MNCTAALRRFAINFQIPKATINTTPPHTAAGVGTDTAGVPENSPVASASKASRYPPLVLAVAGVAISVNEMLAGVGCTYELITPPVYEIVALMIDPCSLIGE